jgi:hypothetical protein
MSIYFTSLACLGIFALGCGSNNNGVDTNGSAGGTCNFGCGIGGTGYGGDAGGDAGNGNSTLKGGKTVASADLLASLNKDACSGWSSELEPPTALLEFVVDVSGSMSDVPINSTQTKWQITEAALSNAIDTGLTDRTGVGILFFPNKNTSPNNNTTPIDITNCVNTSALIPAAPLGPQGSPQRAAIAQGLANAYVAGGTPTDDAYEYAYASGVVPAMQTYGYFNPFMVLITDGQPTISLGCEGTGQTAYPVDWHPIVNDIATAFNNSPLVKTFVIGSPGSEAQSSTGANGRPWLSQAARTGGTQITPNCVDTGPNYCHFDMTQSLDFAADLAQALQAIINSAVPCSFKLPPPTNGKEIDPTKLAVFYEENVVGGTATQEWLIGQTSDATCAGGTGDGWYIDPVSGVMTLCPITCRTVQSDKFAKLNVVGGCKPPAIIFT